MGKYDLPKFSNEVCTSMQEFFWLIYGIRKIGKTTLAKEFPDPYFMFFEQGGKSIKAKKEYIPDWKTFLKKIEQLEEHPGYCKTVIIDTGFMCYDRCFSFKMDELGCTDPTDDWGAVYRFTDREFREANDRLITAGVGVVVTAHSELEIIKRKGMPEYTRIKTELGKQAFRYYNANADVIVYYDYNDDGERILTIGGDASTEAGVRLDDNFFYTNGERIKTINVENSEERSAYAYKMLEAAFNNELSKGGKIKEKNKHLQDAKKSKNKKLFFTS